MGTAQKALKMAKYVAGLVNAESKYFETSSTGDTANFNGTIFNIFQPAQGTAVNQRSGDSVKMKNLTFRGQLVIGGTNELVRIIIFIDKENSISGANTLIQGTGTTIAVLGNKIQDNKYDSRILWDKTFNMTSANTPMKEFKIKLKLDSHVNFNAGTTTVANGALKMALIGQSAGGSLLRYDTYVSYLDN